MRELIGKGLLTAAAASSVLTMSGGYAQATDSGATAAGSPGLLSGNSVQAPVEIPVNVCGNTVNPVGVGNPAFGNGCGNSSGAHAAPKPHQAPPKQHDGPRAEPAAHGAHGQAPHSGPRRTDHGDQAGSTHGGHQGHGSGSSPKGHGRHAAPASHAGHSGSSASGAAQNSPGLLSGNLVQAPLDIPLNVCGNSVDLVGVLNPAFGNSCANGVDGKTPEAPVLPPTPVDPPDPTDPRDPSKPPGDRNVEPPNVPVPHNPQHPRDVQEAGAFDQLARTGADMNLLAGAAVSAGLLLGGGILYRRNRPGARV
ncbi:chaplin [Streptomyces sp. NBC_00838]|uniref:chaplin n=1 Tax=Streptomyces sp. NBC_00838 TaxID=2903680 RepID=UPI00386D75E3|nr:chaplin [Streptomyces sp. NBC_00838]